MKVPQIQLKTAPALIGIETRNAKLHIEQPQASLDLQQPPAEMTINRKPSKLTIDQTEAWAAVDLKSIRRRNEEFADEGKQEVLNGIARRAQQGQELMQIENQGNPIANLAKMNSERPAKRFNIGFIPPHFSVKVNYEPSEVKIDWKTNKVINQSKTNKPILEYEAGKVDITLRQRNSLEVDFINKE